MKQIFILLFSFWVLSLSSQRIIQPKLVELDLKGVIYKSETSYELKIHENGFALGYNKGEVQTYYRTKFYHLEIGMLKDTREKRQNKNYSFTSLYDSNSFVFGKINNFINVRASLGFKRYLSEKAKRKGLAVGYSYSFGPTIGILKPYYLDLFIREGGAIPEIEIVSESYSEDNADRFLNLNDIYGSSSFFKGFNKISVVPGIQAQVSSHFALGAFDKYVKAIEIGIMMDLYIKKIDILIESDEISNKPYFVKLFISGQLGYRK